MDTCRISSVFQVPVIYFPWNILCVFYFFFFLISLINSCIHFFQLKETKPKANSISQLIADMVVEVSIFGEIQNLT